MSYSVEYIENEDAPYDYSTTIVIEDDNGTREYRDGGEPEDQTFYRDWNWVADELIKAYHQANATPVLFRDELIKLATYAF